MRGRSAQQRFPGDFPLCMATPSAGAHCTSILSMLIKAQQSLPGVTGAPGCLFSQGAGYHFPMATAPFFMHTGQHPQMLLALCGYKASAPLLVED